MARKSAECSRLLRNLATLANKSLAEATAMEPGMYTSNEILDLEREQIFKSQWLCAGRSDSIPNAGDYLTYEIDRQPVVVIRQSDGSIAAFANVCRHRMMTLLEGSGRCKRIVCPYHAWTYGSNGQLLTAPYMQDRPGFDKSKVKLPTIRCEAWCGWIYLTLDAKLASVSQQLLDLEKIVTPYKMENYIQIVQQDHIWKTNWKQLTENFMEGYHLPVTHRATVGAYFPIENTRFSKAKPDPAFTYQTFTKTGDAPVGTAHKDNSHLKGAQRSTSVLCSIFPSHMYSLAPDHLWYLSLQPLGTGQVRIRFGAAVAPEVLAASKNPKKLIRDTCTFLDQVNQEDKSVVEGIHRGVNAPLSTAGPLCWLERENHEFTQYIARKLC